MTTRPVFVDGAILAAADLSALEATARDRDARHARHLHTPGVAAGLELRQRSRERPPASRAYVDVTLTAGYAVDGTGRELVLAADEQLSPDRFLGDNPNPPLRARRDRLRLAPGVRARPRRPRHRPTARPARAPAPAGRRRRGDRRGGVRAARRLRRRPAGARARRRAGRRRVAGAGRVRAVRHRHRPIPRGRHHRRRRHGHRRGRTGRSGRRRRRAGSSSAPAPIADAGVPARGRGEPAGDRRSSSAPTTAPAASPPLLSVDSAGQRHRQGHAQRRPDGRLGAARRRDGLRRHRPPAPRRGRPGHDRLRRAGGVDPGHARTCPTPSRRRRTSVFLPAVCEVDADRRVVVPGSWLDVSRGHPHRRARLPATSSWWSAFRRGRHELSRQMVVLHLTHRPGRGRGGGRAGGADRGQTSPGARRCTCASRSGTVEVTAELLTATHGRPDADVLTRPTSFRVTERGPAGDPRRAR